MNAGMYFGQTQVVTFGPVTIGGAPPASTLLSCTLRVVDNVDSPNITLTADPLVGTVDDDATWEGHFDLAALDTLSLTGALNGRRYFYTIRLVATDGSVVFLPIGDDGEPVLGELTMYTEAG